MKMKALIAAMALGVLMMPSAQALDLLRAYQEALANDPTYRGAIKEFQASDRYRDIGRAALLPQLSASYSNSINNSKINSSTNGITNNHYPSYNGTIQFSQPLFNLESLAKFWEGHAQVDLAEQKFKYQGQDIFVRVFQAYTDLLLSGDQLRFLTAQKDSYLEQMKANELMYKKGEGTVTDILETRAAYSNAESQILDAITDMENNRRKLVGMIRIPVVSVGDLVPLAQKNKIELSLYSNDFDYWKDLALQNNPEINAMKAQVEIGRREYERNLATNYPTVALVASYGQQKSLYTTTINQQINSNSVGVQVNIPLFSGGEIYARTSQAISVMEKYEADLDSTTDKVLIELKKQFDTFYASQKKIDALTESVRSNEELRLAIKKLVRAGVKTNADALLIEKNYTNSLKDLAQAKYLHLASFLKLRQQSGTLSISDLEILSGFFRPNS